MIIFFKKNINYKNKKNRVCLRILDLSPDQIVIRVLHPDIWISCRLLCSFRNISCCINNKHDTYWYFYNQYMILLESVINMILIEVENVFMTLKSKFFLYHFQKHFFSFKTEIVSECNVHLWSYLYFSSICHVFNDIQATIYLSFLQDLRVLLNRCTHFYPAPSTST